MTTELDELMKWFLTQEHDDMDHRRHHVIAFFDHIGADPFAPAGTIKKRYEEHPMLMRKFGEQEKCECT